MSSWGSRRALASFSFALGLVVLGAGVACSSGRLPAPPFASQPTSALLPVPYPAPPARVERVPKRPEGDVVWIDGEWVWQTRRWMWRPGRWVTPPAGAWFSPWTSVRDENGTLFVAAGTWRDARGEVVAEPGLAAESGPSARASPRDAGAD